MDGSHLAPLTRRAGFWVRAVAWGVDFCADAIAVIVVTAAVYVLDPASTGPRWLNTQLPAIVLSVLTIAYSSFEIFAGATPGKMILGLKIATARGHTGRPVDPGAAVVR